MLLFLAQKSSSRDFPGGPVAKTDPCRHPSTGGPGSTPCQGTRSHMPQLRVRVPQRKIPHVTSKTQHSQINKLKKSPALRPRCQCGPWSGAGWAPPQRRCPAPAPPWEVSGRGLWGSMGRGAHFRKSVLQHALHHLSHLREEQSLHHPRSPWGRRAQASLIATLCPACPGHVRAPTRSPG